MIILTVSFFSVLSLLFLLSKVSTGRSEKAKRAAYQRFLQEDRMHSTLEYRAQVTNDRRDTRVWR